MTWQKFQSRNHSWLTNQHGTRRVLDEPRLPSGSRPDHVVLDKRGRVDAVLDSKFKARLTHADVDQLTRNVRETGAHRRAFIVRRDTEISAPVEARLSRSRIQVIVDDGEPENDAAALFTAFGAGGIAYKIAKHNGSQNAEAWGLAAGLAALLLTA